MKKKYTISLEDTTWSYLEELARQRNFVYRGRVNPAAVIEAFVDAYRKKRAGADVESPPTEASARDEEKQPAERKPWTMAAIMEHWPEKDVKRYKQDEWKYRAIAELILQTVNEQSP